MESVLTNGKQVKVESILDGAVLVNGLGSATVATASKGWCISRIKTSYKLSRLWYIELYLFIYFFFKQLTIGYLAIWISFQKQTQDKCSGNTLLLYPTIKKSNPK